MLSSLYIKNLAIIDEINIKFTDGLNIITGETGSGKSLLIKAIQLLLGKKITNELVRSDTDVLVIEGVFNIRKKEIVIRRVYNRNKQSKTFINELPVSQKDLINTTRYLADLHGQHDHQNLLDSKTHLNYLDSYGSYSKHLINTNILFKKLKVLRSNLHILKKNQKEFNSKKELYEFQLKELAKYPITKKYEIELVEKYKLLSNANEIKSSLFNITSLFESGEASIINNLNKVVNELDKFSSINNEINESKKRIDNNRIDIEDLAFEMHKLNQGIVIDPLELEIVNEKISYIEMLKRKYGGSVETILAFKESLIHKQFDISSNDKQITSLQDSIILIKNDLLECSQYISKMRHKYSKKLEKSIAKNLKHLNMQDTIFRINLITDETIISPNGIDRCEFFISTNLGEKLLPIREIASGGEISRIMLSIKMAMQSKDIVNTLIFDEIDVGISGATAEKVGKTFEKLSESHQILCITHLSQIAGKGFTHFQVSKSKKNNRVNAIVKHLSDDERVIEIAKLISGLKITEISKKQAKELMHSNG